MGIYDFVMPIYLKEINVSFANMGIIFGISSILIYFLRLYVGVHSDRIGRKPFYTVGLLFSALGNFFAPVFTAIIPLTAIKTVREASLIVRDTMRSLLVFENGRKNFLSLISKTIGMEFFLQGVGTMIGGLIATRSAFFACGAALLTSCLFFTIFFKEDFKPAKSKKPELKFKNLLKINLPPKLRNLTLAMFIMTFGMNISHCFIMPLFFMQKFHIPAAEAAIILMLHRFILGAPMFIYGNFMKGRNLKLIYIVTMAYEALAIGATALIPNYWLAVAVWLTHDLFGASLWSPIQSHYIQEFAREESRGRDVSESIALASLGAVFAPFIAGALAPIDISLPFLVSGIVTMLAVIPLFKL
jgi:DHA1 family quinolone resistance protein-like MFS transporter